MNSPEEKAAALVNKFMEWTPAEEELELLYAKKSAEACVDEIISALNEVVDDYMHVDDAPGSIGGANYYQQVKEEIQKL